MFMGEYQHNIDAKGRVIIPSKLRENLSGTFIVTRGLDKCLFIYDRKRWEDIIGKLKELPWTDPDVRRFARFFTAGAVECSFDSQGRILIPQNLREHAMLDKLIVTIGVVDRIEIWNKALWDDYNNEENFINNGFAEKMAALGI
ncbi:division/cell wall cluster transcriptional repressor MraZ [Anaerotignum faecicola]|nr:division/cell wall cluster transcriptional repressor MraZ [Anaerotignum faecicola]